MPPLCMLMVVSALALAPQESSQPLFVNGRQSVTFVLRDAQDAVPRLVLFGAPNQSETAASINYWRGTSDLKMPGVVVEFKGIRFLRSKNDPDKAEIRLVGLKNEIEWSGKISVSEFERGEPMALRFGPVTLGYGPISAKTDATLELRYDAKSGVLDIQKASGCLEWKHLFSDPQSDCGALTDIKGEVGELPSGSTLLHADGK